jgi:hypothetical protein
MPSVLSLTRVAVTKKTLDMKKEQATPEPNLLDRFIPHADVRQRHETLVRAPAAVVLDVARAFDLQSVPLVRALFWLRARLLGAKVPGAAPQGLVVETVRMGWGVLYDDPERVFVAGAACQPWQADVLFTAIPPNQFVTFAAPDHVKIVWTLEVVPAGPALTRFATETRVCATDQQARRKFRRYWQVFGVGIVLIRWLLLPAIRGQAERRWRATRGTGPPHHGMPRTRT